MISSNFYSTAVEKDYQMFTFIENGTITDVQGFQAAGIHSGIKKVKKDLALIYSETPCTAAGTFTLNKVKAAPLLLSQAMIAKGGKIRAVLVNSGNANACTGEPGYQDAVNSQLKLADVLGILPNEILVSSTGVIGQRMPMEKLLNGIEKIKDHLSPDGGHDASQAIMTTDTKPKTFAVKVETSRGEITIGGICKGSGMIMPNMATMLGFIGTDAEIDNELLQILLRKAVNKSFNKITVDGDTSTNDMVVLLANGLSKISILDNTTDFEIFFEALTKICQEMAKSIVVDGEGATKLVEVTVINALSEDDAAVIGKTISNSPLVKTAIHGQDANWGRIISAVGNSGAEIDPAKISIYLDDSPVLLQNYNIVLNEKDALEVLKKNEFKILVDLGIGSSSATWWTCDLSADYIRINADYRS